MALTNDDKVWIEDTLKNSLKEPNQVNNDDIDKSKSLAKISKRLEELKEKLEGGQLKADEASNISIEYKILKKNYKGLIDDLKIRL